MAHLCSKISVYCLQKVIGRVTWIFKTEVKNPKCLGSALNDGSFLDNGRDAAKDCWKISEKNERTRRSSMREGTISQVEAQV